MSLYKQARLLSFCDPASQKMAFQIPVNKDFTENIKTTMSAVHSNIESLKSGQQMNQVTVRKNLFEYFVWLHFHLHNSLINITRYFFVQGQMGFSSLTLESRLTIDLTKEQYDT